MIEQQARDWAGSVMWLRLAWADQRQRGHIDVTISIGAFLIAFQEVLIAIQASALR